FGIQQGGQTMVAFLLFVNDVHDMGLKVAQGLQLLEAFYWDMNYDTRAIAKRFAARPGMNGKMPSASQAGVDAATLAYLNGVPADRGRRLRAGEIGLAAPPCCCLA